MIYATLKLFLTSLMLVKNNFRRLPRRTYSTARNDDKGYLKNKKAFDKQQTLF
ncbi:MAG: hypothetical protein IKH45_08220 [Neisseriaceae bacterium]|nr:hypothetical protein [Neisseriaceae bacterium]